MGSSLYLSGGVQNTSKLTTTTGALTVMGDMANHK